MPKSLEGKLLAKDLKLAIVISRFNQLISSRLLEGALDVIFRHGGEEKNLEIIWVPGCWEIPLVALKKANQGKFDAVICLGAIIRGDTPHFDVISTQCAKGIAQASLSSETPIAFGVLTCDTMEQALDRAGGKSGNKGRDAALSAIEMANLMQIIEE